MCGILIAGLYALFWATHASDGTGGARRLGILSALTAFPAIMCALRARKLDDPKTPALVVLPSLVAFVAIGVALLSGFAGDDAFDCVALAEGFDVVDPNCSTSTALRRNVFFELLLLWLSFGAFSYLMGWLALRKEAAAAD